jgi:hypothetical protein
VKFPQVLTYLIARRRGDNLSSRFVSVIEPYMDRPLIKSVQSVETEGPGNAIEVVRSDGGKDLIIYDETAAAKKIDHTPTDGHVAVIRRDSAGKVTGKFLAGGTYLEIDGQRQLALHRTGKILSLDPSISQIRIKPDGADAKPSEFVGRVVHFTNDLRRTAHTIIDARSDGDAIILTASDDLLVGRARVDNAQERQLTTRTALPLEPIYHGATLADDHFQSLATVDSVHSGHISLTLPIKSDHLPKPGDEIWLVNLGPGEQFDLPAVLDVQQ